MERNGITYIFKDRIVCTVLNESENETRSNEESRKQSIHKQKFLIAIDKNVRRRDSAVVL
jgi:hypothetical protein